MKNQNVSLKLRLKLKKRTLRILFYFRYMDKLINYDLIDILH